MNAEEFRKIMSQEVVSHEALNESFEVGMQAIDTLTEEQAKHLVSFVLLYFANMETENDATNKLAIILLNRDMLPLIKAALALGIGVSRMLELL